MELLPLLYRAVLLLKYLSGSSEDTSNDNEGCGGVGTTSSDVGDFRRPYTIFVEGNVGSGKSTTLKYFSNRTDVDIVFEPVAQWQNFSGTNFLKLFFEDPKRWTGAFTQLNSLTRYVNSLRPTDRPIRMMERSVYSGYACFLATSRERGDITNAEYALAEKWFKFMDSQVGERIRPDLIVYVRCNDLDLLQRRIKRRARSEEANIDPKFLQQMMQKHEDWLFHKNSSYPLPAPVLVVDGTLTKQGFLDELKRLEPKIMPQSH